MSPSQRHLTFAHPLQPTSKASGQLHHDVCIIISSNVFVITGNVIATSVLRLQRSHSLPSSTFRLSYATESTYVPAICGYEIEVSNILNDTSHQFFFVHRKIKSDGAARRQAERYDTVLKVTALNQTCRQLRRATTGLDLALKISDAD